MTSLRGLGLISCILLLAACGNKASVASRQCQTHLPLEMSPEEYTRCLEVEGILKELPVTEEDKALREILRVGGRALAWERKLDPTARTTNLSAPRTARVALQASKYNAQSITQDFVATMGTMPVFLRDNLFSTTDFPGSLPFDKKQFDTFIGPVVRSYSYASRWLLLRPFLPSLKAARMNDIRGYYALSRMPNLEQLLSRYSSLPANIQAQYQEWLLQMCFVSMGVDSDCQAQWASFENGKLHQMYLKFEKDNKNTYDHFFQIASKRSDVKFEAVLGPEVFRVPFSEISRPDVRGFVQNSIETRWQGSDWKLLLSFVTPNPLSPKVEFQTGVTPHVDSVGGNIITMDDNVSLTDQENQAVMAHEFGHVLGFLDCYVEFYDSREGFMVDYYIDTTNLMCSRNGRILPTHYEQLSKAYPLALQTKKR